MVLICTGTPGSRPDTPDGDVLVYDDGGPIRLSHGAIMIDAS